jgi:hypothetical protein
MQPGTLQRCLSLLQKRWGPLFNSQVTNIVAYGSGALSQSADPKAVASNTLDLLIEVKDSSQFHR